MRTSFNWLKEHVELPLSAADLPRHLLQLGFEVSELTQLGPAFTGVVVAKVVSKEKHPNADKLAVCVVDDGSKKWNVVCGAPNVAAGQTVAFARVGAVLPGGLAIGKAKLRGVESEGMICSAKELGMGGDHSGILELPNSAQVGSEYGADLPRDTVLEVEITPNRPDCLSHRGLARELAAYFRLPLKPVELKEPDSSGEDGFPIEIADPKLCPRYQGRLFTGVKVGPSPAWLRRRLESVGQRSINNVVDATNFVLLDLGQPLHVFDADKLEGGIVVRRAKAGEALKALDGQTYALGEAHLVIADKRRPQAIAGVMGGADSAVTEKTTRVFLESAHFAPAAARRSSQSLRLRSDSSYRFERGTDPEAVPQGALRAAAIIGGTASKVLDAYPSPRHAKPIRFTAERINSILGSAFPAPAVEAALKSFAPVSDGAVLPPTWRWDLETVWDLAEEVGRMLGYGNIPSRVPAAALRPARSLPATELTQRAGRKLASMGFSEAYNYDIVSESLLRKAGLAGTVFIDNPISAEWAVMRPALLPGLLANAALNANRGAQAVRLFELGKGYERAGDAVHESLRLAGVMLGPASSTRWRGERRDVDFFDVKGAVEEVLAGAPGLNWKPGVPSPVFHPKDALSSGKAVSVGRLHPERAAAFKLERHEVLVFELVLDELLSAAGSKRVFTPYSQFPGVVRDLSLVNEKNAPYAELEAAVKRSAGPDLRAVELIDVFDEKKSLTMRLQFGRGDRTLRDAEVNEAAAEAVAALGKLGAVLRS